jgi:hypothetical protein
MEVIKLSFFVSGITYYHYYVAVTQVAIAYHAVLFA